MTTPNSPGDMTQPVVMNPSAIGNPDETPRVFIGSALAKALGRCGKPLLGGGGDCGGVNGFHNDRCRTRAVACSSCDGEGHVGGHPCESCYGQGETPL